MLRTTRALYNRSVSVILVRTFPSRMMDSRNSKTMRLFLIVFIGMHSLPGPVYSLADCTPPSMPCTHCDVDPVLEDVGSFPVGSYVYWSCQEGFVMEGDMDTKVWVCGNDGEWIGEEPTCRGQVCVPPPVPAFGILDIEQDTYDNGESVQYSCNSTYTVEGNVTNKCNNGMWISDGPTCTVDCSETSSKRYSSQVCFSTIRDQSFTWDEARRHCEGNEWTMALVTDLEYQLHLQEFLSNGSSESTDNLWIGAREGFNWKWYDSNKDKDIQRLFWGPSEPNGAGVAKCLELRYYEDNGTYLWNDEMCTSSFNIGHICESDTLCTDLHQSSADEALLINHNGKCFQFVQHANNWEASRSDCTSRSGRLAEIPDASTQSVLSTAALRLSDQETYWTWWIGGFMGGWFWVDGSRVIFDQWSPGEPNDFVDDEDCVELRGKLGYKWNDVPCNYSNAGLLCQKGIPSCGDPGAPAHGLRTPDDRFTFDVGAQMVFRCDPGYQLSGADSVTCLVNGTWDQAKPTCQEINCSNNFPTASNATILNITSTRYRGVVTYTCAPGFVPSESPIIYCTADGSWSAANFTCIIATPDQSQSASSNLGAILGGCFAVIVIIVLLIIAFLFMRRRREPTRTEYPNMTQSVPNKYEMNDGGTSNAIYEFDENEGSPETNGDVTARDRADRNNTREGSGLAHGTHAYHYGNHKSDGSLDADLYEPAPDGVPQESGFIVNNLYEPAPDHGDRSSQGDGLVGNVLYESAEDGNAQDGGLVENVLYEPAQDEIPQDEMVENYLYEAGADRSFHDNGLIDNVLYESGPDGTSAAADGFVDNIIYEPA